MISPNIFQADGPPVLDIVTSLSSLEVDICFTELSQPTDGSFHTPGATRFDHEITRGRAGGSRGI